MGFIKLSFYFEPLEAPKTRQFLIYYNWQYQRGFLDILR